MNDFSSVIFESIKMYIRVSSLSVVRAGRKFSRVSTLVAALITVLAFLFLVTLISTDRKTTGETDIFYRQGHGKPTRKSISFFGLLRKGAVKNKSASGRIIELPTWNLNQSVILEDYLDLGDPNSYIRLPRSSHHGLVDQPSPYCGPNVQVLIMVASAPKNFLARMAIRDTWGSKRYLGTKGGRIVFVLGSSENGTVEQAVTSESNRFGDILEEDFHDSYHNLTLKSMAMLKWVNLTCSQHNNISMSPKYVLKTDDDIFINFERLLKVLHDSPHAKMIGRLTCGAVPIGDPNSKIYMPKYLYPGRVYPGYLSGTAYVLRTDIIPTLLHNALTTPLVHLEDIYVTGLLARQSHIYPDDSAFFTYNRIALKDDCAFRYLVDSHQMTPQEMRVIWSNLKKPPLVPCSLRKAKWLRKIPRLNKRIKNLCLFQ